MDSEIVEFPSLAKVETIYIHIFENRIDVEFMPSGEDLEFANADELTPFLRYASSCGFAVDEMTFKDIAVMRKS